MILEFGVYQGESLRWLSSCFEAYNAKCVGFDTFMGITQDWIYSPDLTIPAGTYTTDKVMPSNLPQNTSLVVGDATQTITEFLLKHNGIIRLAHLDMDIYQPTKKVLQVIKDDLCSGSILIFDEHHGYPGWKHNEYKALNEVFHISEYRYIAFSEMSAAIQII